MLMQFLLFFWGGGEGDIRVNKVYYGQCESGKSPTQKKRHLFSLLPLFYSVAVDHVNNTLLVITNLWLQHRNSFKAIMT